MNLALKSAEKLCRHLIHSGTLPDLVVEISMSRVRVCQRMAAADRFEPSVDRFDIVLDARGCLQAK